jgi:hypothetical protein
MSPHLKKNFSHNFIYLIYASQNEIAGEFLRLSPTNIKSLKRNQVDLSHLLNFVYEFPSKDDSKPRRHHKKRYHIPFKRERFLQANCRFLVSPKPNGDYSSNLGDADSAIDWTYVEEVIFPINVDYECVICLYPPIAPKITKCGHIFCFVCIIRYILQDHFSSRVYVPCPVCQEKICVDDLRIVHLQRVPNYKPQSEIEFVKLKRLKESNIIQLVANETENSPNTHSSSTCDDEQFIQGLPVCGSRHALFNRLTLTLDSEPSHQKEEQQLFEQFQLSVSSGENDQLPYLEAARQLAQEQTIKYQARKNLQSLSLQVENLLKPPVTSSLTNVSSLRGNNKEAFYFYQERNGQQIYTHPLNVKWLLNEYGSFERFPPRISGTIVDIEDWTQDEVCSTRSRSNCCFLNLIHGFSFVSEW